MNKYGLDKSDLMVMADFTKEYPKLDLQIAGGSMYSVVFTLRYKNEHVIMTIENEDCLHIQDILEELRRALSDKGFGK